MENQVIKTEKELLAELDKMEESIKLLDILKAQYDDLKSQIKTAMVKLANTNELNQVKWITPKGTQITCSIGHTAEIEKQNQKVFNEEKLKTEYPEIYEKCCEEKEVSVITKNATSDRLVITLPKE